MDARGTSSKLSRPTGMRGSQRRWMPPRSRTERRNIKVGMRVRAEGRLGHFLVDQWPTLRFRFQYRLPEYLQEVPRTDMKAA